MLIKRHKGLFSFDSLWCTVQIIFSSTIVNTHLHTEAGFGPSERQNFDLHLLTFGDHVSHISYSSFFTQLWDVDQTLPTSPADTQLHTTGQDQGENTKRTLQAKTNLTWDPPAAQNIQTAWYCWLFRCRRRPLQAPLAEAGPPVCLCSAQSLCRPSGCSHRLCVDSVDGHSSETVVSFYASGLFLRHDLVIRSDVAEVQFVCLCLDFCHSADSRLTWDNKETIKCWSLVLSAAFPTDRYPHNSFLLPVIRGCSTDIWHQHLQLLHGCCCNLLIVFICVAWRNLMKR